MIDHEYQEKVAFEVINYMYNRLDELGNWDDKVFWQVKYNAPIYIKILALDDKYINYVDNLIAEIHRIFPNIDVIEED